MVAAGLALLASCATYEALPLEQDERDVVARALDERAAARLPEGADALDHGTALAWMVERNPALRRAVAAWRAAEGFAEVDTPPPDPQVQVGSRRGLGSDLSSNIWSGLLNVTFTLPTGDRRAVQDALNDANAEAERIGAVLTLRDGVLALRGGLARLALSRQRLAELEALAEGAERAAELVRRGQRAGSTTALDTALADLEAARARAAVLEAREAELEATHAAAVLMGVPADRLAHLADSLTPALPLDPPGDEHLRDLLARHHPELVRRRADYVVAEHQLHLQVELSHPDLQIQPSYNGENGEDIHVLQLGFQFNLPVFNGNVTGIRAAEERRGELREDFAATAAELLAGLEAARAGVALARERVGGLREGLLPIADRSTELARRAVDAGAADALRVLAVERAARELRADALAAELDLLERWLRLERAVGAPLFDYAGFHAGEVAPLEDTPWAPRPTDDEMDAQETGR